MKKLNTCLWVQKMMLITRIRPFWSAYSTEIRVLKHIQTPVRRPTLEVMTKPLGGTSHTKKNIFFIMIIVIVYMVMAFLRPNHACEFWQCLVSCNLWSQDGGIIIFILWHVFIVSFRKLWYYVYFSSSIHHYTSYLFQANSNFFFSPHPA